MDNNLTDDELLELAEAYDAQVKAQRRADLVTLAAAALGGMLASEADDIEYTFEYAAGRAVGMAEATLDLITERTK